MAQVIVPAMKSIWLRMKQYRGPMIDDNSLPKGWAMVISKRKLLVRAKLSIIDISNLAAIFFPESVDEYSIHTSRIEAYR